MRRRIFAGGGFLLVGLASVAALAAAAAPASKPDPMLGPKAVALLRAQCLSCHAANPQGGLDLRSREALLKGGGRGPAVVPGNSAASLLYKLVAGHGQPAMPQGRSLERAQIALLKNWIDQGASWPEARHWAFQPPKRPAVPTAPASTLPRSPRDWVRNPVDAFILARLQAKGLTPSPEADRRTLLRRVTLDLTGLPPTPEEIRAFLADRSPDAYEKAVRRLLASPQYGVRWAQHWLDVVRFAETNGFELDGERPQAWRYRDYVVRALNEDRPYDRFLTEQIAGDEIDPDNFELRAATGFLRAGPRHIVGGNVDQAVDRQEYLTEAVAGVGSAFMGLTIGCARCHDHKYDPVPQADYYRLQAFFAGTQNVDFQRVTDAEKAAYETAVKAHKARLKPIQDEIAAIEKPYRDRLRQEKLAKLDAEYKAALAVEESQRTPEQKRLAADAQGMLKASWDEVVSVLSPADREQRAGLRQRLHAIDLEAPAPLPMAPAVADSLDPVPPVHLLIRGDAHTPGPEVQPGYIACLVPKGAAAAPPTTISAGPAKSAGRRTALARWLTRPDHPLTARVMVNRLWQGHFGRGLVATPNDFGINGARPTHPELLDWLAGYFVAPTPSSRLGEGAGDGGQSPRRWSLKAMHYLMVTSATYRQSSEPPTSKLRSQISIADPDNRLLWRQNRRRLDAEQLRDSVLQAAGALNLEMGGPPVRVPLEKEVYDQIFTEGEPDNLWPVTPDPRQHTRRSLYLLRKRNVRLPMLAVFDAPDMMTSCAARLETVHSLQALTLLNSDFMTAQSQALARRLLGEAQTPVQNPKREPGAAPASGTGVPRAEAPLPHGRGSVHTATRVQRLYELTLCRTPTARERAATERFLKEQTALIRARMAAGEPQPPLPGLPAGIDPVEAAAWADLCLAALNLNDFVYVE